MAANRAIRNAGTISDRGLAVFDVEVGEKIIQLHDVLLSCGAVFVDSRQFQSAADIANLIESVSPSVAFHSMSQHLNSRKVLVGQCMSKRVEVFSPVGQ